MKTKQLPKGWEEKKVAELCDIISGSTPKTGIKEFWGGDIFWITPKDLSKYDKKYILETARTITQEGYDSCSTIMIKPNNVLMSSRAPIGYLVINKVPICTNQGFKSFIIKNKSLNPEYLYYYLKSIVDKIKNKGSGTTFNELSKTQAGLIKIIYPESLPLQKQIVSAIETQFTRLDESIKSLKAVKQKIGIYRKAVLKKSFEKKGGWEEKKLDDVCEKITDGSHNPPKKQEKGIKMLSARNIFNGKLVLDSFRYISQEDFKLENKRTDIKENDVLLTIVGTIGRSLVVKKEHIPFTLQRSVSVLKPKALINSYFLHYYLLNPKIQQALIEQSRGVAQKGIYLGIIKKINISYPASLPTQKLIVSSIESKFLVIDKVEKVVDNSLKKAEMLRKSILKVAFEGRLVENGMVKNE